MICPEEMFEVLCNSGVSLYTGVPDSLLIDFCAYVTHQCERLNLIRHVITANEGAAVALAAGHYLATDELAVVYMQNSGLGNAINPLTSLVAPSVYSIPLLMLIGWRGEPGIRDEPQHSFQGGKTIALLKTLEIPYVIIDASTDIKITSEEAAAVARGRSCPYALVAREKTFKRFELNREDVTAYPLTREEALKKVINSIGESPVVVSTTGMTSRELFEYRESLGQGHGRDFLTVGSMGHASQIALGIAISKPDREVYCLDGDGSAIMHMGAFAIIGSVAPRNFRHIIINNGAHDSVGGQPTAGFKIDFREIGSACGYIYCRTIKTEDEISEAVQASRSVQGPSLLEIRVNKGYREDLGRPKTSPSENKFAFMEFLRR